MKISIPNSLFHCTSLSGLKGILGSGFLRAVPQLAKKQVNDLPRRRELDRYHERAKIGREFRIMIPEQDFQKLNFSTDSNSEQASNYFKSYQGTSNRYHELINELSFNMHTFPICFASCLSLSLIKKFGDFILEFKGAELTRVEEVRYMTLNVLLENLYHEAVTGQNQTLIPWRIQNDLYSFEKEYRISESHSSNALKITETNLVRILVPKPLEYIGTDGDLLKYFQLEDSEKFNQFFDTYREGSTPNQVEAETKERILSRDVSNP